MGLEPLTCWEPPPEGAAGLPTVLEPAEELEASLDSSTEVKSKSWDCFYMLIARENPSSVQVRGSFQM